MSTVTHIKPRTKLRLVEQTERHICDEYRSLILKRDWSQTMINGDRAKPVVLPDARSWRWR